MDRTLASRAYSEQCAKRCTIEILNPFSSWERRLEYVNKVIEMQLKEDQLQHKAIRSGKFPVD